MSVKRYFVVRVTEGVTYLAIFCTGACVDLRGGGGGVTAVDVTPGPLNSQARTNQT